MLTLEKKKDTKKITTRKNSKMSSKRTNKSESDSEMDLAVKKEFQLNQEFQRIPEHQKKHMLGEIAEGKMSRLTILHLKNLLSQPDSDSYITRTQIGSLQEAIKDANFQDKSKKFPKNKSKDSLNY